MDFLGDMALVIGTVGVIIYLCLVTIRFSSQASRLRTAIARREEQVGRLAQRLGELKEKREAMDPEVDQLVTRMVGLRETRDRLCFQYEEMVARSREREINIGYKPR